MPLPAGPPLKFPQPKNWRWKQSSPAGQPPSVQARWHRSSPAIPSSSTQATEASCVTPQDTCVKQTSPSPHDEEQLLSFGVLDAQTKLAFPPSRAPASAALASDGASSIATGGVLAHAASTSAPTARTVRDDPMRAVRCACCMCQPHLSVSSSTPGRLYRASRPRCRTIRAG